MEHEELPPGITRTNWVCEDPPKPTYTLTIANALEVTGFGKIPNKFHRLMMRLILGVKIEEIKNV